MTTFSPAHLRRWKRLPLGILAVSLAALVGCGGLTSTGTVPPRGPRKAKAKQRTAKRPPFKVPDLDLGIILPEPEPDKDAVARTLFAFEEDPAVIAEQRRRQEEQRRKAEEERLARQKAMAEAREKAQEQAKQVPKKTEPPKPKPPNITFSFIGYLGYPQARVGVFREKGAEETTLASAGEVLFERFTVVELGYESVEIGFVGFEDTERLPLKGGGQ